MPTPLSPTKAFLACNDLDVQRRIEQSPPNEITPRINEESLNRAREFVFSSDHTNLDLIQKTVELRVPETGGGAR